MVPKVDINGQIQTKLRRVLDFAMDSRLAFFLVDHSRPMNFLFEALESKFSSILVPPIL